MKKKLKLTYWQTQVFNDKHRFKVINCGRRAGKSYLVSELVNPASKSCWFILLVNLVNTVNTVSLLVNLLVC